MKKLKNIVPIPLSGEIAEPGCIWEESPGLGLYSTPIDGINMYINERQAADRRIFEPVEEPSFIADNDLFGYITREGMINRDLFHPGNHQSTLAVGNCFRTDTNLNPHGVHIDDALKVFKLALRVPKLWGSLRYYFDPEDALCPMKTSERFEALSSINEIEAATPQKGREA